MSVVSFSAEYLKSIETFRSLVRAWLNTFPADGAEFDPERDAKAEAERAEVAARIEVMATEFGQMPDGLPKMLALAEVAAYASDYSQGGQMEQAAGDLFQRHAAALIVSLAAFAPLTKHPPTVEILRAAARSAKQAA